MTEKQEDLRDALRRMFELDVTYLESVWVALRGGETEVGVFAIHGHQEAVKVYGWTYETESEIQYLSSLHLSSVKSPIDAVRLVGLRLDL